MTVRYTKDHEWVRIEGPEGVVGITPYAAQQLGDVVYVELPAVGRVAAQGKEIAAVESVKAASEIYAPVSGQVMEVNPVLAEDPAKVNESPEDEGWFFKLAISNLKELDALMDAAAYQAFLKTLDA